MGGEDKAPPKEVEVKAKASEPEPEPSMSDIVSQMAQVVRRDLNFMLDEGSGKTVVKIIDSQSGELVRQIPSEEMLALARRLQEMTREQSASGEQLKGLLVTTKV
jgi:flagellar protein FlaG